MHPTPPLPPILRPTIPLIYRAHAMISASEPAAEEQDLETPDSSGTDRPAGRVLLRIFGILLCALLLGYALMGKGFAYLHIPGEARLFAGELVLGLGLFAAAVSLRFPPLALRTGVGAIFTLFLFLGLVRTVPGYVAYGMDALRDAVLYGYGLFLILVPELIDGRRSLLRVASLYRIFALGYVLVVPGAFLLQRLAPQWIPLTPGTDVPLLSLKPGEVVVHATAAVTWFLLVPRVGRPAEPLPDAPIEEERGILWHAVAGIGVLMSLNRGAWLSMACALACAAFFTPIRRFGRAARGLALAVPIALLFGSTLSPGEGRQISAEGLSAMVRSVFTEVDDRGLGAMQGTKDWRLRWWSLIAEETFTGPWFWTGRGFGVNLADVHGFQVHSAMAERRLRSPHNSHMTVLARMGVPGLVLWVLLHGALAVRFLAAWRKARDAGDTFLSGLMAWLLCYWTAFVVNSSFDVYFEGPMGAIWFWSVMGLGVAASTLEPETPRPAEVPSGPAGADA